MSILAWILFGLVAGAIAKFIMPGNQGMGWLMTIILGIVGAFVGGAIGEYVLGWTAPNGFDFRSIALAVLGALLVLWIYGMATRRA